MKWQGWQDRWDHWVGGAHIWLSGTSRVVWGWWSCCTGVWGWNSFFTHMRWTRMGGSLMPRTQVIHLMKIQCVDQWCLHLAEQYQWGGMRLKILLYQSVRLKSLLHSCEVDEDGWQFAAQNLSCSCLAKIQCLDWCQWWYQLLWCQEWHLHWGMRLNVLLCSQRQSEVGGRLLPRTHSILCSLRSSVGISMTMVDCIAGMLSSIAVAAVAAGAVRWHGDDWGLMS